MLSLFNLANFLFRNEFDLFWFGGAAWPIRALHLCQLPISNKTKFQKKRGKNDVTWFPGCECVDSSHFVELIFYQTCSRSFWKGSRSDIFFQIGSRFFSDLDWDPFQIISEKRIFNQDQDPWTGLFFMTFCARFVCSWTFLTFLLSPKIMSNETFLIIFKHC